MADTTATPSFEASGNANAPGIVFVHGTRMAGAYWHAQRLALHDRYHIITVDLPGHGRRRDRPFSHREALDTIIQAIAQCRGDAAVVVGHSLGGYLVMDVAAEVPDRCRGLVLVSCSAVARGLKTWLYRAAAKLVPMFSEGTLTRWNDRFLRWLYPSDLIEPQITAGYGFAAIPASWRAVLGRDHAKTLSAYPGPVLFVNGARDLLFRSDEAYFVQSCQNAELEVLVRAGHLCNLDRPTEFSTAIDQFAARVFAKHPIA